MSKKRSYRVCRKAIRTHFLHTGHLKKRFDRSSGEEVSRRMALWTHNLTLDVLKNVFGEFDEVTFRGVERPYELIFAYWASKKATWLKPLSDVLCKRMTLRSHNLPSGRLKKQLCLSGWSDVSTCRKALRNHFLHPEHRIKLLGWSRLSD
jgi:hypothetical protein